MNLAIGQSSQTGNQPGIFLSSALQLYLLPYAEDFLSSNSTQTHAQLSEKMHHGKHLFFWKQWKVAPSPLSMTDVKSTTRTSLYEQLAAGR